MNKYLITLNGCDDTTYCELELTDEQGIARNVILNELDNVEKQVEDYQKRFNKTIEELEMWQPKNKVIKLERDYLLNLLKGEDYE